MKLLFVLILLSATISRAERVVVFFKDNAKDWVVQVAHEQGVPIVHLHNIAAMIEVTDAETFSAFVLKVFENEGVLRIKRRESDNQSILNIRLPWRINENAVRELLAQLEDVGGQVFKIKNTKAARQVGLSVPAGNIGRLDQELRLRIAMMENFAQTQGTEINCAAYFSK